MLLLVLCVLVQSVLLALLMLGGTVGAQVKGERAFLLLTKEKSRFHGKSKRARACLTSFGPYPPRLPSVISALVGKDTTLISWQLPLLHAGLTPYILRSVARAAGRTRLVRLRFLAVSCFLAVAS